MPLSLRHPRAMLAVAFVAIVVLALAARGVEDKLTPTSPTIPGTESSRGERPSARHFGDTAPFAILLQGPAATDRRPGAGLIRALRTDPAVTTALALGQGSVERLRPGRARP